MTFGTLRINTIFTIHKTRRPSVAVGTVMAFSVAITLVATSLRTNITHEGNHRFNSILFIVSLILLVKLLLLLMLLLVTVVVVIIVAAAVVPSSSSFLANQVVLVVVVVVFKRIQVNRR